MRLMATNLPGFIMIGVTLALSAGTAGARPPALTGDWRLNEAQSELLPGDAPPAELIMSIAKDDEAAFRWTVRVKMADGAAGTIGFDGAIDGKPYPIKGRPGSTSAFSWAPNGSLKRVDESAGGIVTEICAFSADMRTMNCEARQTDTKGRVATYIEVFDRQSATP